MYRENYMNWTSVLETSLSDLWVRRVLDQAEWRRIEALAHGNEEKGGASDRPRTGFLGRLCLPWIGCSQPPLKPRLVIFEIERELSGIRFKRPTDGTVPQEAQCLLDKCCQWLQNVGNRALR